MSVCLPSEMKATDHIVFQHGVLQDVKTWSMNHKRPPLRDTA